MTAATVIALAVGLLAIVLGVGSTGVAPRVDVVPDESTRHRIDRSAGQTALVDAIERTARDVRSGTALRPALIDAMQHDVQVLPGLHDQLVRGAPLQLALAGVRAGLATDAAFVLQGLRLAADTGGAMADTLDRVVAVVRERHVWRGERHAQAAQARLSARMLTALPMAVAAWGVASGPRARHAYTESPITGVLSAFGVALNLTGWWWMRRLVRGTGAQ